MPGDENRKILLETVVFRPVCVRRWFGHPKATSSCDDLNGNNIAAVDTIAAGRSDASSFSTPSYIIQRLKGFNADENMDFEKWITLKGMKMAFFGYTVLSVLRRTILAKFSEQIARSSFVNLITLESNVSDGLRKCLTKSVFSGVVMAANIGCIIISITQLAFWREYFSLWTVPCATSVIPVIFSYSLGVKPLQAVKSGLMLGVMSSLPFCIASVLYDLSIDETYQYIKSCVEIYLKKERESELYIFMKDHKIRSKWFGKLTLNRSRINEDMDDEF